LISWKQHSHKQRTFGTALTNPNFKKYAESFGIRGYSPRTLAELRDTLETTIKGQELSLVEVCIQPRVNYELSEKLNRDMNGNK